VKNAWSQYWNVNSKSKTCRNDYLKVENQKEKNMHYIEFVAILAVLQYLVFGFLTGQARRESGLKAPTMTGHDGFERMYRVQMNTLETLVAFLPALFLAGKYLPEYLVAGLGVVYLIGRMIYWRSYVSDPSKRAFGFMLSMMPTLALVALAVAGIFVSLFGMQQL
jgi:glutathione S-transferase